jgi:mRNA-degrading endonuclease RelE of RelBE toxin-antitoxin system
MTKQPIEVRASRQFQRDMKQLAKKYRYIQADVQPILESLQSGQFLGDQIPNIERTAFKVRIANTDAQKGKRGGYRLIYYIKIETRIILITIYPKSDIVDINPDRLLQLIIEAENEENKDNDEGT